MLDVPSLVPLIRLPRLRCLKLSTLLTVDGFSFLCTLPPTELLLCSCYVVAATPTRSQRRPVAATSTCKAAVFPERFVSNPSVAYPSFCVVDVLASYADSPRSSGCKAGASMRAA